MCSLYYNFNVGENEEIKQRMSYDFKENAHFKGREAYEYCDNDAAKYSINLNIF